MPSLIFDWSVNLCVRCCVIALFFVGSLSVSFAQSLSPEDRLPRATGLPTVQMIIDAARGNLHPVARSGNVLWKLGDIEHALKKYRAWVSWQSSSPEPVEILQDASVLRRLVITAVEREVIVRQVKQGLHKTPVSRKQLRAWLISLVPGSIRPTDQGLDNFIRGRLSLRAKEAIGFFWEAAEDAYLVKFHLDNLVENLSEEEGKEIWRMRGELVEALLVHIPRVPSSSEISDAPKRFAKEMKTYYDEHQELFSQPMRLLAEPYWIRGGKLERERQQATKARDRFASGEQLDDLLEDFPLLTRGGVRSLRGRSIPKNTEFKSGAVSPVRLTRYGWTFYKIQRVYPAYVRSFKERNVQREVAAAVLIEKDELLRASVQAQHAIDLLSKSGDETYQDLKSWAKAKRIRVSRPDPFFSSPQEVVPTVGLAPQLHGLLVKSAEGDLIGPIKVRQHYIIAKILKRQSRSENWEDERERFMSQWKQERRPVLINHWLNQHLADAPRWISQTRLKLFDLDAVRFEAQPIPQQTEDE